MLVRKQSGDRLLRVLSKGLGNEDQGHWRIELICDPGPPGYETTALPPSHSADVTAGEKISVCS